MAGIQQEIRQQKPFASPRHEAVVALLRTADLLRRSISAVVDPYGITLQQYNVLRILRGAGEAGLPTLGIGERMIEQTPGITRLIDRLVLKKLVLRRRCRTDRRQVFCRITTEGLALLGSIDGELRRGEEAALSQLSERQVSQLLSLLSQARDGMSLVLGITTTQEAS